MPIIHADIHIDIPHTSLTEFILDRITPEREALPAYFEASTGRQLTYGEFKSSVESISRALADSSSPWGGIKQGDVVGVFAPNCVDFAVLFHGILRARGTATTANPTYVSSELAYQISDAGAKILFVHPTVLSVALEAADQVKLPRSHIVLLDAPKSASQGFMTFQQLLEIGSTLKPLPSIRFTMKESKNSIAIIPYSSGTTGRSKGVELSHYNIISNVLQIMRIEENHWKEGVDTVIGYLPLFHMFGNMLFLNVSPFALTRCIIVTKFDLAKYCELVQTYRVKYLHMVPPTVIQLVKSRVPDSYDLSSAHTVISGAAPLGEEVEKELWEKFKIKSRQTWGATEQSCSGTLVYEFHFGALRTLIRAYNPRSYMREWDPHQNGTIGKPLPNVDLSVRDPESNRILGPEEEGEIWSRGSNIMLRYHNNTKATQESLIPDPDGKGSWYRTGDIGKYDKTGVFTITDRLKELIKYKGFQVPPAELESVLLGHTLVADVAVIGVPDYVSQELPKAFIVLKDPQRASADLAAELVSYVRGKVAPHKRLRGGVEFLAEIPKSASGKILRRLLRDQEKALYEKRRVSEKARL
ncbi:acetyl-CoA synthetase-like protein [Gonapodya prolifera JEL478]|uniref:Acetyl-CoA synthetase-like protein n=1 Tax=Gonapodya prolifera (strain JEL478) TaxID=1344416 RepID=A0A139AH58_GONPJ|nr:acetyl-CoA synthetase-like protein [Gonapodya prolifera JEL478]|eukprot:KXS16136.1 acetyl-CoA synthetase-like protein [Gonapodya prolifera JEL478]